MTTRAEYIARFWLYVDKSAGPDACWPWTRATRGGNHSEHRKRGRKGIYGAFWFLGRVEYAHRIAYMVTKGEIPEGFEVDHECESIVGVAEPLCCNPAHLSAVSSTMNALYSSGQPRPNDNASIGIEG